jgi:hypothetical protein
MIIHFVYTLSPPLHTVTVFIVQFAGGIVAGIILAGKAAEACVAAALVRLVGCLAFLGIGIYEFIGLFDKSSFV